MSLHLYASSTWRATNCPGSVRAQGHGDSTRATEPPATPEAEYGREMHLLIEEVIDGKVKLESIDEPGRTYIERCLEFLKERGIEGGLTEKRLFVLGPRGVLLASCRADLLSVSGKEVTIPDWKLYHAPMEAKEWEWQGLTMCAAALQEYPEAETATAIAYLPILGHTNEAAMDRPALEAFVNEAILPAWEAANEESPPLRPGDWCARCSALAGCPAALDSVGELAKSMDLEKIRGEEKLPTVKVMTERFYDQISTWSRGRYSGAVELLPFLPALTDAIKLRLRDELAKGINHTSWELKGKNLPRAGSVSDVRSVLADHYKYWLDDPEEFLKLCKPSFGEIQKFLKEDDKTPDEIREILQPFEQGETKELRRRK